VTLPDAETAYQSRPGQILPADDLDGWQPHPEKLLALKSTTD
jgi:hypothetical protein